MSYGKIGDAVTSLFVAMAVALMVFVPLGLWKLIEILLYLNRHLHLNWQ